MIASITIVWLLTVLYIRSDIATCGSVSSILWHDNVIKWNHFRAIGPLCGEFTGRWWIPITKDSDAELWCFLCSAPWIDSWGNNDEAGNLRRHRAHYDVIVMIFLVFRHSTIPAFSARFVINSEPGCLVSKCDYGGWMHVLQIDKTGSCSRPHLGTVGPLLRYSKNRKTVLFTTNSGKIRKQFNITNGHQLWYMILNQDQRYHWTISLVKLLLLDNDFLNSLLIGSRLCCQPIRNSVRVFMLDTSYMTSDWSHEIWGYCWSI